DGIRPRTRNHSNIGDVAAVPIGADAYACAKRANLYAYALPISNIINGEYSNPVRVVAFNSAEGWSRDVTENIAEAVLERGETEGHLSESAKKFVECMLGEILR